MWKTESSGEAVSWRDTAVHFRADARDRVAAAPAGWRIAVTDPLELNTYRFLHLSFRYLKGEFDALSPDKPPHETTTRKKHHGKA